MEYQTSFTVMPCHANYMNMIFGGELLARMDIACAETVRLKLDSEQKDLFAVTVAVDGVTFFVGADVGDIIFLNCKIARMGIKSIVIEVEGFRQKRGGQRDKICTGKYTFVTKANAHDTVGVAHGMKV